MVYSPLPQSTALSFRASVLAFFAAGAPDMLYNDFNSMQLSSVSLIRNCAVKFGDYEQLESMARRCSPAETAVLVAGMADAWIACARARVWM